MKLKQNFNKGTTAARPYTWFIGERLVTWTAFWTTIPVSILIAVAFVNPNRSNFRDILTWTAIALISHASMAPFVHYLNKRGSRRVHFLVTFFLGALKGAVLNLIAPLFLVLDPRPIYSRAINSGVVLVYIFCIVSIIQVVWGKFERDLRELLISIVSGEILPESEKSNNRDLIDDSQRQEAITKLGALLENSVAMESAGLSLVQQAQAIDQVIAKNIRPKSSERWKEAELIWPQINPWRLLKNSAVETRAPVLTIMVLVSPLTILGQYAYSGATKSLLILAGSLTLLALLVLLTDRMTSVFNKTVFFKNTSYFVLFLLVHQPVVIYLNYKLAVFSSDSIIEVVQLQLSAALSGIILVLIGMMILNVYNSREQALEQLQSLLPKEKFREAFKLGISSNAEADYAQYLHSNVQAQLTASKLLLLKAAESNFTSMSTPITQEVLARLEKLKIPYEKRDVRTPQIRLNELIQTWQGLARIKMDLPSELSAISKNGEIISQLIEELVINAIRHGKAKNVRVRVWIIDSTCHISVQDDGKLKSTKKQGLGSTFFDVFAPDWKIGKNQVGTLATLTTPF
jgi:signal transduction histidine kinase